VLEDCENILDGGERIRTIVGDLSTFARRPDGQLTGVDLNRVVSAAANMVRHTLRHRAGLFLELAPSLPRVRGDEARLAQVFVNLLVNAAQAIPEGQPGQHSVRVRSEEVGSRVRVTVSDTGHGMSAEVTKHIFEPFFTTKAPGVGTGLGLSIVHGIVAGHGGSIRVESAPGRGSEFVLELPIDSAAERRPSRPSERPLAPPAHILIIDDEEAFAAALRAALTRHQVSVAVSGRAGLAVLLEGKAPDLILCDVMMPGFTGMDVLDELYALRPWLAGRFVFMTGGAVTERARQALAQARCPILHKPFSRDEVEHVLAELRRQGSSS
jgi:CheY-like chemotaxis protein